MVAISAVVHPASASMVTAVPRKSWKCKPSAICAFWNVSVHSSWKRRFTHAPPAAFTRTVVARLGAWSSAAFSA